MNTIVINLFAGPGAGKSTLAAAIFAHLKCNDVNAELVREYAKDVVWEENYKILDNQIFVFGKQLQRINRLLGKVDVIVTDAPLMNSLLYYDGIHKEKLSELVVEVVNTMNNVNYFIDRKKKYNPAGRMQTEDEAKSLDIKVRALLEKYGMPYTVVEGRSNSAEYIANLHMMNRQLYSGKDEGSPGSPL